MPVLPIHSYPFVWWELTHISPLNTALMLWLIVTTILAVLRTPGNQWRFEMSEIKEAVMRTVRVLFVAAWISTVLALIRWWHCGMIYLAPLGEEPGHSWRRSAS
jgi:hypothetical protein